MRASTTVSIYLDTLAPPRAELNNVNPQNTFATVELVDEPGGRVYIALRSRAEADALVRAAAAARDMLPGDDDDEAEDGDDEPDDAPLPAAAQDPPDRVLGAYREEFRKRAAQAAKDLHGLPRCARCGGVLGPGGAHIGLASGAHLEGVMA